MFKEIWCDEIKINFVISSLSMYGNTVLLHEGIQYVYACVSVCAAVL